MKCHIYYRTMLMWVIEKAIYEYAYVSDSSCLCFHLNRTK